MVRQLAKMVGAGLSLEKSLVVVARGEPGSPLSRSAERMIGELRSGASPAEAFATEPAFDRSLIAIVRSGEVSGDLADAFRTLERLVVTRNGLRSKVRSGLVYPAVLSVVALGSVLTILLFVIPKFEPLVASTFDTLPLQARLVFGLSSLVQSFGTVMLALLAVLALMIVRAARMGRLEAHVMAVARHLPGIGGILASSQSSRICRLIGTLAERNVHLVTAVTVTADALEDSDQRRRLFEVRDRIKSGETLAKALGRSRLVPPLVVQLVEVGEETGDVGGMLQRSADLIEESVEGQVKRFLILFEPILLAGIGVLIGGLLYGLFSAILSVNSSIL
jgi:general secretion pathway protein F